MRLGVIGSRNFNNYDNLKAVLDGFNITTIVSGGADGADTLGERYADENDIEKDIHEADWNNLDVVPCAIRTRRDGSKYNVLAGFNRNTDIVNNSDMIIVFWDGKSTGTRDSMKQAHKQKKDLIIIYF